MDDAGAKLEARAEPIYHPVWGKDADELTIAPFTQNSAHPPSTKALTTLGLNTNAMSAMSRKSSIVRSQLVWVSNDDDMMRCIVRNHPAVGYFNDVQESGEFGPCF
jgi:hypothetical protein